MGAPAPESSHCRRRPDGVDAAGRRIAGRPCSTGGPSRTSRFYARRLAASGTRRYLVRAGESEASLATRRRVGEGWTYVPAAGRASYHRTHSEQLEDPGTLRRDGEPLKGRREGLRTDLHIAHYSCYVFRAILERAFFRGGQQDAPEGDGRLANTLPTSQRKRL